MEIQKFELFDVFELFMVFVNSRNGRIFLSLASLLHRGKSTFSSLGSLCLSHRVGRNSWRAKNEGVLFCLLGIFGKSTVSRDKRRNDVNKKEKGEMNSLIIP